MMVSGGVCESISFSIARQGKDQQTLQPGLLGYSRITNLKCINIVVQPINARKKVRQSVSAVRTLVFCADIFEITRPWIAASANFSSSISTPHQALFFCIFVLCEYDVKAGGTGRLSC